MFLVDVEFSVGLWSFMSLLSFVYHWRAPSKYPLLVMIAGKRLVQNNWCLS
jgi:hypothetical protein